MVDERDLVLEKMGIAVGGFRLGTGFRLGWFIAVGSVASLHWVLLVQGGIGIRGFRED